MNKAFLIYFTWNYSKIDLSGKHPRHLVAETHIHRLQQQLRVSITTTVTLNTERVFTPARRQPVRLHAALHWAVGSPSRSLFSLALHALHSPRIPLSSSTLFVIWFFFLLQLVNQNSFLEFSFFFLNSAEIKFHSNFQSKFNLF